MALTVPVTFSMQFVSVSISSLTMSGFAEGEGVSLDFPSDDFDLQAGSDGFAIFVQKHNPVLDGTIRLTQGNPLIAQIRLLHEASLAAGGVTYPFTAINLKSPDEVCTGALLFKKRIPIKWADSAQPAEIPFFLTVSSMTGGTLIPT